MQRMKGFSRTRVVRKFRVTSHAIQRYRERIDSEANVSDILESAKRSGFYNKGRKYLVSLRSRKTRDQSQYIAVDPQTDAVFVCSIEGVAKYTIITVMRHSQLVADIKARKAKKKAETLPTPEPEQ